MNRTLRYLLLALLWGGVVLYIVHAATTAGRMRRDRRVERLTIDLADSSSQGFLIRTEEVRRQIAASKIATVGRPIDSVDLSAIESLIARNGFVKRVVATVSYEGELCVRIHQHRPVVRLLLDGHNCYVTSDGYAFAAPPRSSLYLPVVTGSYRPPFEAGYEGEIRALTDRRIAALERAVDSIERCKYPHFRALKQNDSCRRAERRRFVKRVWWKFESDEAYEARKVALKAEKKANQRRLRWLRRGIESRIDRLDVAQRLLRDRQKKLEKNYEDFMKLLTFVEWVENDDFWRSEIVQISAHTTPSGAVEVDLTPRSGRHLIRFGRLEHIGEKFDKLSRFYREGLSALGWDSFRSIDIRYDGQVVCRR